jgi:micrococcal nuclease
MRALIFLAAMLGITFLCAPGKAESFKATVVATVDGDTLTVSRGSTRERVILYGIDCPELTQDFGKEARQYTDSRCYRKVITIDDRGKDAHGRTIAVVYPPDGTNLNQDLLKEGLAWWSDKYAPNELELKQLQQAARTAHKGLWSAASPIPPWTFRNGQRSVHATIKPSQ